MSKLTPFALFIRQALLYPLTSPFLPPVDKVLKNYSYANGVLVGTFEGVEQKNYPVDQVFVDNGDGTISDVSTGLMWPKDGNGAGCNNGNRLNNDDAIAFGLNLNFAGHTDWRLPDVKELQTICAYWRMTPAIHTSFFTNTYTGYYWSSTPLSGYPDYAFYVGFGDGGAGYEDEVTECAVRAVRDY